MVDESNIGISILFDNDCPVASRIFDQPSTLWDDVREPQLLPGEQGLLIVAIGITRARDTFIHGMTRHCVSDLWGSCRILNWASGLFTEWKGPRRSPLSGCLHVGKAREHVTDRGHERAQDCWGTE
jgi:hypothetical protein